MGRRQAGRIGWGNRWGGAGRGGWGNRWGGRGGAGSREPRIRLGRLLCLLAAAMTRMRVMTGRGGRWLPGAADDTFPSPACCLHARYPPADVTPLLPARLQCEGYLDQACVQRLGAYTCFALMFPRCVGAGAGAGAGAGVCGCKCRRVPVGDGS